MQRDALVGRMHQATITVTAISLVKHIGDVQGLYIRDGGHIARYVTVGICIQGMASMGLTLVGELEAKFHEIGQTKAFTLLGEATFSGKEAMVGGSNVSSTDIYGQIALHWAAMNGLGSGTATY